MTTRASRAQRHQGRRRGRGLASWAATATCSFQPSGKAVDGFFRDGRAASLADQAELPFTTLFEMANASADEVLARLLTHPYLAEFTAVPIRTRLCGPFKVPALREIALTAPYFHNGVFETLEEAVTWYITRDTDSTRWYLKADGTPGIPCNDLPTAYVGHINVAEVPYIPRLAPTLTNSEIADLARFLCALTDGFDVTNPAACQVPAQCQSTAASVAATRAGAAALATQSN
ncbi:cytochrome c peroxidase [Cupriavidus basilensis]|uniref:Cytochrome c peroxidase n=1 Tax=Cupriavidus basilensis TaxID=68895 RepID=A0ABT6AGS6_9BURK|nr:cytochrome c peroxidase [Cupriavidus basilensis]MDF3831800.1 cytochrome c peroxidase [Cupriavidus basilensis]